MGIEEERKRVGGDPERAACVAAYLEANREAAGRRWVVEACVRCVVTGEESAQEAIRAVESGIEHGIAHTESALIIGRPAAWPEGQERPTVADLIPQSMLGLMAAVDATLDRHWPDGPSGRHPERPRRAELVFTALRVALEAHADEVTDEHIEEAARHLQAEMEATYGGRPDHDDAVPEADDPGLGPVDLPCDLNMTDRTGHVWTFLHEARDPSIIVPGAVVMGGDEEDPWPVRIIDLAPGPDGTTIVHVEPVLEDDDAT